MPAASASAAESNSLQPSVPASEVARDIKSLAPGCDGGSPSSLMTVARTTSSPRPRRRASSSSTESGMRRRPGQDLPQYRDGEPDLFVGRVVAGREAKRSERELEREAHREQHMRRVE